MVVLTSFSLRFDILVISVILVFKLNSGVSKFQVFHLICKFGETAEDTSFGHGIVERKLIAGPDGSGYKIRQILLFPCVLRKR